MTIQRPISETLSTTTVARQELCNSGASHESQQNVRPNIHFMDDDSTIVHDQSIIIAIRLTIHTVI